MENKNIQGDLQVTLMPGSKQGPVRLTIVPPNMFPFSGANTSGRFAPIRSLNHFVFCLWKSNPTWCRPLAGSSHRSGICVGRGNHWPSQCTADHEHRWSDRIGFEIRFNFRIFIKVPNIGGLFETFVKDIGGLTELDLNLNSRLRPLKTILNIRLSTWEYGM